MTSDSKKRFEPISDSELVAYCEQELSSSAMNGDLATEREKAMNYYHGDMTDHLPTLEDRSQATTRDVLDTVESVLPSLLRIVLDEKNALEFLATSHGDEDLAKRETNAVRSVFFRENAGFLNLYTFFKDALLSKAGIFKTYWEDPEEDVSEYRGLDYIEAQKLLSDPDVDAEILEHEVNDDGTIELTLKTVKKQGRVQVDVVTPEEFGISSDAASPNIKDSVICWQTTQKTISELYAMGYDEKILDDLVNQGEESSLNSESLARRRLSDEQETMHSHRSMRKVWVTEAYPLIDRNGDGVAERLKVTLISDSETYSGMTLLEVEESKVPFSGAPPLITTHKFYGYSLADLVMDIQEIRTSLFRGILDNMYLANNGRIAANDRVNLDDLLTSRPGGVVRTEGSAPPGENFAQISHAPIPSESFGLLEVLDDMLKSRTGVGDEVAGLDSTSLANINTGVIQQAYDQARMRIELMARILCEVGLAECFKDIRHELHANQDKLVQFKVGDAWVDENPSQWADSRRMEVKVGLGNHNKVQKKLALSEVLMLQEKAQSIGLMQPQFIHNTIADKLELDGLDINRYFPPRDYQPPPPQPDPKLMIEAQRVQIEDKRVGIEQQKAQLEAQIKMMMQQSKEYEVSVRTQMEQMKGELQLQKMAIDEQSQIMRAQTENATAQVNNEIRMRDQDLKEQVAAHKAWLDEELANLKAYEADLNSATAIETKAMDVEQKDSANVLKYLENMTKMMGEMEQRREEQRNQVINYIRQNGSDNVRGFVNGLA